MLLNKEKLEYLLIGGTILGGGGGGSRISGKIAGETALAYGDVNLLSLEDMKDDDIILTVSGVGAPAAKDQYVKPRDYVRAIELFQEVTGKKISGIITNENGGSASINGFIQSSVLGIPLIDAPANGRAHPTGVMGGLGLHKIDSYISEQVSVGGDPSKGRYIEFYCKGSIDNTSNMIRQSAVTAGGIVAVCRNPVSAKYVKENAAVGAIKDAILLGETFYKYIDNSIEETIENVAKLLKGKIIIKDKVKNLKLLTENGFDLGSLSIGDYELTFWNEYMTMEKNGSRISTFPDLIMTFDGSTGLPVTTAELRENMDVYLISTNMKNLKLGSTMFDKDVLKVIENIIGKDILNYLNI